MALQPLRWQAQEQELVFDEDTRAFHRADCPELVIAAELDAEVSIRRRSVPAGEEVKLVWAPYICRRCRPKVFLFLGLGDTTGAAGPGQ